MIPAFGWLDPSTVASFRLFTSAAAALSHPPRPQLGTAGV